jgi:hypothetical protein
MSKHTNPAVEKCDHCGYTEFDGWGCCKRCGESAAKKEDPVVLLSNLVFGYHEWVMPIEKRHSKEHEPEVSETDPKIYLALPETKKILQQLGIDYV